MSASAFGLAVDKAREAEALFRRWLRTIGTSSGVLQEAPVKNLSGSSDILSQWRAGASHVLTPEELRAQQYWATPLTEIQQSIIDGIINTHNRKR